MDQALVDLIAISKRVGSDPALVQGAGGNTSVKTADGAFMYIKASGAAVKEVSAHRGWRRLKLAPLLSLLDDDSVASQPEGQRQALIVARLLACCEDHLDVSVRPSVEAHLHALLGRYVVHLHPVAVCAYVCAKEGEKVLSRLCEESGLLPLWVPYTSPGYALAKQVRRLVAVYSRRHGRPPEMLFLANHGVLFSAKTRASVLALVRKVTAICEQGLKPLRAPRVLHPKPDRVRALQLAIRKAVFDHSGRHVVVKHSLDPKIEAFLALPQAQALAALPPLTPEELVYLGEQLVWLGRGQTAEQIAKQLSRSRATNQSPPVCFLADGVGLFLASPNERFAGVVKEVVLATLMVRAAAFQFGGARPLTKRQRAFIASWEGESYRRGVSLGPGSGKLPGRIAIVSGAGSGLGRSIAAGLAEAGAAVGLADVDFAAAQAAATQLAARLPKASVLPLRCDVTSEAEVEAAFDQLSRHWGGLDILVNAAGIAPAQELVNLSLQEWRRAIDINLTGYFLMARAAAHLLIEQGLGGSIINLSSKSGLEASRSNTAYNATKAGEIHMARGWALELGKHGIRVNSVAPGNVFEGSKIWNPRYIRECARKYGLKPEEVIPHYIGLTALGREITGQDIANAVIFLCSEEARTITGQTLVADSGQVMVR